MGSRVFPAPQTPKDHVSLAVVRRQYRSARRMRERAKRRRRDCLRLLKSVGAVPPDADASWLKLRRGEPRPVELRALRKHHDPINGRFINVRTSKYNDTDEDDGGAAYGL